MAKYIGKGLPSTRRATSTNSVETQDIQDGAVTAAKLAPGAAVPSQTTHNGKFLTTDGDDASWATVDLSTKVDKVTGKALSANDYTTTEKSKLSGIETSATADQTGAEIKTSYEGESDTNAYTDTEKTKLSGVATSANNYSHPSTHAISEVSGLQTALDAKTTESYVDAEITTLIGAAPAALNTLQELGDALGDDANYASTITTALAGKVDDGQVLTDVPASAVFTDTVYTHPANHAISVTTGLQTALDAKVDDTQVLTNVPSGAVFTDTTYSVGDGGLTQKNFTTADNTKLDGIAASANNYSHPATHAASMLTGALPAIDGSNLTGVGAVTSSASAPSSPSIGDLWLDTDTDLLQVYTSTGWNDCNNPAPSSTGGTISVSNVEEADAYNVDCKTNFSDNKGAASLTYSLDSGTLPVGTSLNTSSGVISGTASVVTGNTATVTYSYTIKGIDDALSYATQVYSSDITKQPIDGGFSSWSGWSNSGGYDDGASGTCSVSCGTGTQNRTRTCTNPTPQYGGSSCSGSTSEDQSCNTQSCWTALVATGGTVTTSGDYKIHTFTGSGTFTVTTVGDDATDFLVIAGGGHCPGHHGAGGAGGYRSSWNSETSGGGCASESGITLSATSYTVTVGGGHSNSSALGITSTRGGNGAGPSWGNGESGGSGGGGKSGDKDPNGYGGSGTACQGYAGGHAYGNYNCGGGGAGGGATSSYNRTGGVGRSSTISSSSVCRAGGGGAYQGSQSCGGGSRGGSGGAANTGGGSGADGNMAGGYRYGGSGIVIIRYKYQ